jgi:iron-sulfur cluster repair protein YtfE (RIC family)
MIAPPSRADTARFVIGSHSMNRPARRNVDGQVARVAETHFLVERYHRAFQTEADVARALVRAWMLRDPRSLEARGIATTLATVCEAIAEHIGFQEQVLFPALGAATSCQQRLLARGTADCASLFTASEGLREVCAVDPSEKPSSHDARLRVRLVHFVNEMQEHLRDEVRLLMPEPGQPTLGSSMSVSMLASSSSMASMSSISSMSSMSMSPAVSSSRERQGEDASGS